MSSYSHRLLLGAIALSVLACSIFIFNIAPRTAEGATTTKTTAAKTTTTKKALAKPVSKAPAKPVAKKLQFAGWIPYWRVATGTQDVLPHLAPLTEVHPFGYTVKKDGTLYDASNLEDGTTWTAFRAEAKKQKTLIIPSITWGDGATIDSILSDPIARSKHEDAIVNTVVANSYDGIDIDYENKFAYTKDDYSAFLKELKGKLPKGKVLSCTIEARTPPDSLYTTIPSDLEYANDYAVINKYCDRVKLMTYDQMNADIKLNKAGDRLYSPIADPLWVSKVIDFTTKTIAPNKISLGVATYGYIYHVTPDTNGITYTMDKVEAFNPKYATDLAASLGITPVRNRAGELYFTYIAQEMVDEGEPDQSAIASSAPKGTPPALAAAAGAMQIARNGGDRNSFYMLWWSDSEAVADKVALAKKKGLWGVSVFKFDGGEDQKIWSVLKN